MSLLLPETYTCHVACDGIQSCQDAGSQYAADSVCEGERITASQTGDNAALL